MSIAPASYEHCATCSCGDDEPLFSLQLPIKPVSKERARVAVSANGKAHGYTPKRTREFEDTVRWHLKSARVRPNESDHLRVSASFYLPKLTSTRGDVDNYGKSLLDAGSGFAWGDDKQIIDLRTRIGRCIDKPSISLSVAKTTEVLEA